MRRYFFLFIFLMIIVLFIGCQGRSLVYQSDTRPSVQTALIITSKPSRAQVEIDGEYLGVTPIRLGGTKVGIDPGERTVVISSGEGYSLETVIEGRGSLFREPDLEYYSVFRQEDRLLIEEGKVLSHHVAFEVDEVELTVEADTGWSFHKWEGDVKGSDNPIRFVMDEEKRVTAVLTYTVSGKIVDRNGNGLEGVSITFNGGHSSVTTKGGGIWSKSGLRGSITVTPKKEGYEFEPYSQLVTAPRDEVIFLGGYVVSGIVKDNEGRDMEGVTITFSDGYSSLTTKGDGTWSQKGLTEKVTVIPRKVGYGFTPSNREVTGPTQNVDFVGLVSQAGDKAFYKVADIDFFMRLAPASTFPTGRDDSGSTTVDHNFWIAETVVTYDLWHEVRLWAEEHGYIFNNEGQEGSHGDPGELPSERKREPVTMVSWYDCIVWCNALSEFLGYPPVYTHDGAALKSAGGFYFHRDVVAEETNGFRLPTSCEWELASRYQGSNSSHGALEYPLGSGEYWTPGNYASGATADYNDEAATKVAAWYWENSDIDGSGQKTQVVGQKPPSGNMLGLFDMSGNVEEWCFTQSRSGRVYRGGSWRTNAYSTQLGRFWDNFPFRAYNNYGFRVARTEIPEQITYHRLIIEIKGQGSTTPRIGGHLYIEGTEVSLAAIENVDGWHFKKWVGDVADTEKPVTTIMMNKDETITVVFEERDDKPPADPGEQTSYQVNDVHFNMRLAPPATFPTGTDDDGEATVDHAFWVAETQVTYELWYEVRMWALDNGYIFANEGREGSHGPVDNEYASGTEPSDRKKEPVTMVNWYDSLIWCNALSEMLGYDLVYTQGGDVLKDAKKLTDEEAFADVVAEDKNGFRLPTRHEWELAARYKGSDSSHRAIEFPVGSGNYWTPGNYASGASRSIINPAPTQKAAWYSVNSDGKTQDVGQKPPYGNGLGLFDMSGNVWELCFVQGEFKSVNRSGGSWFDSNLSLQVGRVVWWSPGSAGYFLGFRFLRTDF